MYNKQAFTHITFGFYVVGDIKFKMLLTVNFYNPYFNLWLLHVHFKVVKDKYLLVV